ncbi:FadR/GntR family transcriptional regulator [Curvibacter microcysteis]|uniref:FadR/GntR family transcriptional regulator n=1 Tax=Curvibacter microcysteis TaxID=3026419 RepID=UPI003908221A
MSKLSTVHTPGFPKSSLSEAEMPLAASPARRRPRGLAHDLVDDFSSRIQAQVLRPGDKLPTESELMRAFGVSRTVVREALSRLQAGGLVETRHGIGTFVLEARSTGMFRIDPSDMATSVDVLAVLELRVSLETESAGLAAVRRTEAQLQAMREALRDFAANVGEGGDTVSPDFRFHLEIAHATGNRYFGDIMSHLGTTIIPRTRISSAMRMAPELRAQYLQKVNREHEEIFDAIARQDAESARAAMRIHLTNSRERLRRAQALAQAGQAAATEATEGGSPPAA